MKGLNREEGVEIEMPNHLTDKNEFDLLCAVKNKFQLCFIKNFWRIIIMIIRCLYTQQSVNRNWVVAIGMRLVL